MTSFKAVLVDHYNEWSNLRPITLTRPISLVRIGILTIKEKWQRIIKADVGVKTCADYLNGYDTPIESGAAYCYINSSILPSKVLFEAISALKQGESLYANGTLIASLVAEKGGFEKEVKYDGGIIQIKNASDIFGFNLEAIKEDFQLITEGRKSHRLSSTNMLIGPADQLFIEEGAVIEGAILNTKDGPIYIGEHAEVMEGSVVRGALALCEHAVLKMATKIYGPTTIGPHSKVGGEVNNSVILGYSNKGHDGFLGNSVIGEWCNLGADTNTSNLKNNYGEVKAYSYELKKLMPTGRQFLGLVMGDHSKCGINTMFNTGTVSGVFANIFGGDFPPKLIPSYAWGGAQGFEKYKWEKALEVAKVVMSRRKIELTDNEEMILDYIYKNTKESL